MSTSSNLFFPKNRDSLNYPAPVLAAPHLYVVIFSAVMMMPVGLPILSSHFNAHSKDGRAVLNNRDFSAVTHHGESPLATTCHLNLDDFIAVANARDFNPEHTTLAHSLFWHLASILVISNGLVAPNDLSDFIDDHSRVGSPARD